MTSHHEIAWENLEAVLKAALPIQESWPRFIELQAQINPTDYWTNIKELDVRTEQSKLRSELEQIIISTPLPNSIIALWIGITKLLNENDQDFYVMYITGTDKYDVDDADWAVEPLYDHENKYIITDQLNLIDDILRSDTENYSFNDWIIPIAYCALTISDILTQTDKTSFLKFQQKLFVTVGYDDGDFINLPVLS